MRDVKLRGSPPAGYFASKLLRQEVLHHGYLADLAAVGLVDADLDLDRSQRDRIGRGSLHFARVVHNLEHGGIYILYGKDVPDATVDQLRAFYESHKTGTVMAPLDRLGDEFALGAWVVDGDTDSGFVAKCTTFDEDAVSSFFRTLQFRGPERFDPENLQPGL